MPVAEPAFMRCDADGVVVGYPGLRIHGNSSGIFGSADLQNGDLKIGHSKVHEFPRADCGGYSDWFVTTVMKQADASLTTSFGHGSPFVFGLIKGGDPRVTFVRAPKVWSGTQSDAVIGVTINDHHLGLFLFNTERTAVEEYWFDVAETNYPSDFPNVALGMVWGGKGAFGTWFSGDIDCVHAINWLPFTPASVYMGRHADYVKKNFDRIVEHRTGGTDFNTGWGDLVAMFGALHDPAPALAHLAANPSCKIESGNSRAFMEHWTGTLGRLGRIDANTSSSHPFTNVFVRDGMKTYAAYNFGSQPLVVEFSDGVVLGVSPRSMAVRTNP